MGVFLGSTCKSLRLVRPYYALKQTKKSKNLWIKDNSKVMPHFPQSAVQDILQKTCEEQFRGVSYDHRQVNDWTNSITETALKKLQALEKPYKYIVNCVIMQASNAGLNASTSVFWCADTDGSASHQYNSPTMTAVVTCYG